MFQPKWRMLRDFITLANIVDSPKWIFDQTRGYKKFQKKDFLFKLKFTFQKMHFLNFISKYFFINLLYFLENK